MGSGGCLATIIGVLEINKRFTGKRRGLAHGWSLAGNTLGGLLLPGSLALLFDQWGRAGALAIHSAVLLNIVPATLFYSSHVVTVGEREEERTERTNQGKVWSNPRFWFCIFSMASTTIGYTNFGLYLPLHLTSCLGEGQNIRLVLTSSLPRSFPHNCCQLPISLCSWRPNRSTLF